MAQPKINKQVLKIEKLILKSIRKFNEPRIAKSLIKEQSWRTHAFQFQSLRQGHYSVGSVILYMDRQQITGIHLISERELKIQSNIPFTVFKMFQMTILHFDLFALNI